MVSNRVALIAVSVACVAAAGAGGYLATRQNQASSALAAPAPATAPAAAATTALATTQAATPPAAQPAPEAPAPAATASSAAAQTPRPSAPPASSGQRDKKAPAATIAKAAPAPARSAAPSSASAPLQPAAPPAAAEQEVAPPAVNAPEPPAPQDDVRAQDVPKAVEPEKAPEKTFDELVVSADSVIGLQLETALNSERAKVEDRVEARVIRDVRVGSHVAIPAGARALGTVAVVERGGKMKDRARLGIRFNTIVLGDGTRVPVTTETIYRYGDAQGNATAQKVGGGAVIGTILGGILGGGKGAAIGAAAGAGGGAAAAAAGDRSVAEFPAGIQLTARFLSPVTVTVEH